MIDQAMRSEAEQIAGLRVVQRALYERGTCAIGDIAIVLYLGDVVQLILKRATPGCNIVYAVGGYDGWREGQIAQTDMTADEAAEWLLSQREERRKQDASQGS